MSSPAPLHTRLRRLDPAAARTRSTLLAALHGRVAGGAAIGARAADGPAPPHAVLFDSWTGPVRLGFADAADPVGAAQALDRLEPLLAAIERALRIELAPAGVESGRLDPAAAIDLDWAGEQLRLLFPAAAPLAPETRSDISLSAALSAAPQPCNVRLAPAPVPIAAMAALTSGAILLCPPRLPARLAAGPRRGWAGRFDLARRSFAADAAEPRLQETRLDLSAPLTHTDPPPGAAAVPPDLAETPVAVTIALDTLSAPLGLIAALAPGSVLELSAGPEGSLPVRLEVGGRTIATGELVAIGEAYGVLITQAG